jgi:hypothetical protein
MENQEMTSTGSQDGDVLSTRITGATVCVWVCVCVCVCVCGITGATGSVMSTWCSAHAGI